MSSFANGDAASAVRAKLNAVLGGDFSLTGTGTGIPSPGAIGGVSPAAASFTNLTATTAIRLLGGIGDTTLSHAAGVAGTTGEAIFVNNQPSLNVIGVQNNSPNGFSAYICRDPTGREHCAFGYGNSLVSFPFTNAAYWEASAYPANGSDMPPYIRIIQTGTLAGGGYGNYRRMEFADDGFIFLFAADGSTISQAFGPDGHTYLNSQATIHGLLETNSTTAVPAGGNNSVGIKMSSVANLGIFPGSGAPTLSAAKGSLYLRIDGSSSSTRMYSNTDGGTTWTPVTTAT